MTLSSGRGGGRGKGRWCQEFGEDEGGAPEGMGPCLVPLLRRRVTAVMDQHAYAPAILVSAQRAAATLRDVRGGHAQCSGQEGEEHTGQAADAKLRPQGGAHAGGGDSLVEGLKGG